MSKTSAYEYSYLPIIENCCRLGFTDKEIASILGVNVKTLVAWRVKDPELAGAMKDGKEVADARVERTLYQAATTGFTTRKQETKTNKVTGEKVVTITLVEHPPSVSAMNFWLSNRMKAKYSALEAPKEQDSVGHTVTIEVLPSPKSEK